ncbi:histamine H2 receptor-like [Acropora muricata]|uniref:histamine H2 receptor-like n=1 Tax=Acropora muricata TaxID=159855 RepID=UPI0034E4B988
MVNSRLANITSLNASNPLTFKGETQDVHSTIFWIIPSIIINGITCPFTFILNVLVIAAVKRRPRLQSNANIMLACLAVTDALIGLTAQPLFVLSKICLVLRINNCVILNVHEICLSFLSTCSCLHLMLVVFERLVAIKFPFRYPFIVTRRNIKLAVPFCWIYCSWWIFAAQCLIDKENKRLRFLIFAHTMVPCVVFVLSSYGVLYFETRRHQKKIKTQQLPQNEKETFIAEGKALRTTALVFGALVLCLFPVVFIFLLGAVGIQMKKGNSASMVVTFAMLNSLMNPLIYCWRQREMRKFVFRRSPRHATDNDLQT